MHAPCPLCNERDCNPVLLNSRTVFGERPRVNAHNPAPCRVFHAETGQLLAGTGAPLPEHVPAHLLVYENEALRPADSTGPDQEPQPATVKRTRVRTRPKPQAENR